MAIIKVRSPHFLSVSIANLASATLDIEIYTGDKATGFSGTPTYSLSKQIILNTTQISFEIAELIRDYLDTTFTGDYDASAQNGCKWVRTILTAMDGNGVQLSQATSIDLAFDSYSYFQKNHSFKSLLMTNDELYTTPLGDFEIQVYTEHNPNILFLNAAGATQRTVSYTTSTQSNAQIKSVELFPELCVNGNFTTDTSWTKESADWTIDNGASFLNSTDLAIDRLFQSSTGLTDGVSLTIRFTVNNFSGTGSASLRYPFSIPISRNGVYEVTGVGENIERIQFQAQANDLTDPLTFSLDNVSVKKTVDISSIRITDDNSITNLKVTAQCGGKYEPFKVTFNNKFGVLQDLYFFKKSVEKMTTKRESYKANTLTSSNTYSISSHTKRDFNIVANESISLSSGFVNESFNEVFKQMMLSEKVWITNTTKQVLPINIKTSNITYKTSTNDKLVEYTIEFENSYNVLNDIR